MDRVRYYRQNECATKLDCRSDLRSYLLERGIISPSSTREQLVVLAKQDYKSVRSSVEDASEYASNSASNAADQVYSAAASIQSAVSSEKMQMGRSLILFSRHKSKRAAPARKLAASAKTFLPMQQARNMRFHPQRKVSRKAHLPLRQLRQSPYQKA